MVSPAVMLRYGVFIDAIVSFVITAFLVFLLIKAINSQHKKQPAAPLPSPKSELLLEEIRDLLKVKQSRQ